VTPSLPRTCSTPELRGLTTGLPGCSVSGLLSKPSNLATQQPILWSGRRDSNPRPTAWKAVTLPTELLPPFKAEVRKQKWATSAFRFLTSAFEWWREEGSNLRRSFDRQIYSLLLLTTQPSLRKSTTAGAGGGTRTRDLLITNQLLCQLSYASDKPRDFKDTNSLSTTKQKDGAQTAEAEELRVIAKSQTVRKREVISPEQVSAVAGPRSRGSRWRWRR
jgi:hypothetical protein